ncbi:hypothetical protein UNSWCD_986 [Campylobacter concisus UNSWCD]|nr:hypothetical protein UNSWCD_986 [Campylobacter concisus UNSWCD]
MRIARMPKYKFELSIQNLKFSANKHLKINKFCGSLNLNPHAN